MTCRDEICEMRDLGQEIRNWRPRNWPERRGFVGRMVRMEPIRPHHAHDLYEGFFERHNE